jgi:hypothetical protein
MDGDRFDQFTRSLVWNVSRRSMLKGFTTLLAGSTLAARPLSAKGAPSTCNAYCAGEPGPRGAQCRQACKTCGGPDSPGFCYDELVRGYTCCPAGLSCFDAWRYPGGETIICCPGAEQVCSRSGGTFCCAADTHCANEDLCCPIGVGSCYDQSSESNICGSSCRDLCLGFDVCGDADENGYCTATTCSNPCNGGEPTCGPADEQGNCLVETCLDVCSGQTYCSTPNERGNCFSYYTCYDPCSDVDVCQYPDSFGNCSDTTCYNPELGTTVCGSECWDYCGSTSRCGVDTHDSGYCDGSYCSWPNGTLGCGPVDGDGNCIE